MIRRSPLALAVLLAFMTSCAGSTPRISTGPGAKLQGEPVVIRASEMQARLVAGNRDIQPGEYDAREIHRGRRKVTGVIKVCVAPSGVPSTLEIMRSTGYDNYDGRLIEGIKEWRVKPYLVDGRAHSACASMSFFYLPSMLRYVPRKAE